MADGSCILNERFSEGKNLCFGVIYTTFKVGGKKRKEKNNWEVAESFFYTVYIFSQKEKMKEKKKLASFFFSYHWSGTINNISFVCIFHLLTFGSLFLDFTDH